MESRKNRSPLAVAAIDAIWTESARRVGFTVVRTDSAYATYDGDGCIGIGTPATLDKDDSLAQLVLHELCHALVQGARGLALPDWGLDNTSDADEARENACLRVQACLASYAGLRTLMTPTTVTRPTYQSLGADPLHEPADELPCLLADAALASALAAAWWPALAHALTKTAAVLLSNEDCVACAACCGPAFERVAVAARDAVVWKHPLLVIKTGPRFRLARSGDHCVALVRPEAARGGRCAIYEDRPQTCRDFSKGSSKCLEARRRAGIELVPHDARL